MLWLRWRLARNQWRRGGELNAVRWNDWKVNFAGVNGNIATGSRLATSNRGYP
jgi:hypothetical protein